ncbi:DUF4251 domain-containing protein [uncultured Coprobacter sp.]|uniref:DUF4251 domain-containing protein n=1 Tax=Coprobacter sp. TaxID=1941478 RepID=UPI0026337723|nr:DUF4251 domain-containing protein [uncultured Coprobacter sp.]
MKNNTIIIIVCFLIGIGMVSQLHSSEKISQKKISKHNVPDSTDMKYHAQALAALKDSSFVFNTHQIIFNNGISTSVSSVTNFISLNKNRVVVQIAFDTPYIGYNGLGGITVEGHISTVKMRTDKKGFTRYEFYANGTGISARVELTLHPTNNSATAIISPNFNSKQLNLSGSISPLNKAYIYKGTTL